MSVEAVGQGSESRTQRAQVPGENLKIIIIIINICDILTLPH